MVEVVKEGVGKIVKYVNTPLHAFTLICVVILLVIWFGEIPNLATYILIGILALIVIVIIIFLFFDSTKLQFTAEEQIVWKREHLGDSISKTTYYLGEISNQGSPELIHENPKE